MPFQTALKSVIKTLYTTYIYIKLEILYIVVEQREKFKIKHLFIN